MSIFTDDDFLLWYLIFMDGDILTCSHCGGEIERYEIDKDFGDPLSSPRYGKEIREEDFEVGNR